MAQAFFIAPTERETSAKCVAVLFDGSLQLLLHCTVFLIRFFVRSWTLVSNVNQTSALDSRELFIQVNRFSKTCETRILQRIILHSSFIWERQIQTYAYVVQCPRVVLRLPHYYLTSYSTAKTTWWQFSGQLKFSWTDLNFVTNSSIVAA